MVVPFNPYNTTKPASGERFVGRADELEAIQSDEHTVIFGYSRWGKTSLLTAAANAATGRDAVYIPDSGSDIGVLNRLLTFHIGKKYVEMKPVFGSTLDESLYGLNEYCTGEGKKLHVLLDETQPLFSDPATVMRCRAYNQELESLVFTYSIFPHVFSAMQTHGSRFQDSVRLVPLKPFDSSEVQSLVDLCTDGGRMERLRIATKSNAEVKPYWFADDFSGDIADLTGGLPFFVQGIMGELCDAAARSDTQSIDLLHLKTATASYAVQVREQVSHLWNALTPIQKDMLHAVLEGKSAEDIMALSAGNPSQYFGAFNPLSEKGVGIIEEQDGEMVVRGVLMRDALQYMGGFK